MKPSTGFLLLLSIVLVSVLLPQETSCTTPTPRTTPPPSDPTKKVECVTWCDGEYSRCLHDDSSRLADEYPEQEETCFETWEECAESCNSDD